MLVTVCVVCGVCVCVCVCVWVGVVCAGGGGGGGVWGAGGSESLIVTDTLR